MKTIWKFSLTQGLIEMPVGAEVIAFQFQKGVPTLWAIVDPDAPKEIRKFCISPTGGMVFDDSRYIGTVQDARGLVYHAFEGVGK